MLIVTAADAKYRELFEACKRKALEFGYGFQAFDLGGLGEGTPVSFADPMMQTRLRAHGYYQQVGARWRTKCLHKPEIMLQTLEEHNELVVWLDADAILTSPIDEVDTRDYDLGVVLRCPGDSTSSTEFLGLLNSGVVFAYPTAAGIEAVRRWTELCQSLGCDQKSLNHLVQPEFVVDAWRRTPKGAYEFVTPALPERLTVRGIQVRYFPWRYNCFIFPPPPEARVLHFKGKHRRHFATTLI